MYAKLSELVQIRTPLQAHVVAIISAFFDSGFLPEQPSLATNPFDGSISLQLLPPAFASFMRQTTDRVQLSLRNAQLSMPVSLALVVTGSSLQVTANMDQNRVSREFAICDLDQQNIQATRDFVERECIQPIFSRLLSPEQPRVFVLPEPREPEHTSLQEQPQSRRPGGMPLGLVEDPLRFLPGHTPEGGDQVGPHHPLFGDPRFDPLGPGNVGEPDYDHQVPPPFGQAPRPRGPPRFPPGPGGGSGGRFGGPRML